MMAVCVECRRTNEVLCVRYEDTRKSTITLSPMCAKCRERMVRANRITDFEEVEP